MEKYDLIVIGSGPAGYIGSIRAAQLGMKVACIEKRSTLGGTCLNVGCIPSKALLHSSLMYEKIIKESKEHGILIDSAKLDINAMLARKDKVVSDLTKGISSLFAKNKITKYTGVASFVDKNTIAIKDEAGFISQIAGDKILIASGSDVIDLPNVKIDEKKIVSSTGALDLKEVPKKMIVIGAGVIGLEMSSIWRRLGAEVTVVEFAENIVPSLDIEIGKSFHKCLEKQGIKFKLNTKVSSAEETKEGVEIVIEDNATGKSEKIICDILLVAIGRKPYTQGLELDSIGVALDERGRIKIDSHFKTNIDNIYAVGDVVIGPMLAHKAEEEAVAAVEMMKGQKPHINYDLIPGVIYTHPEVASVGKTEEDLKKARISYKVGKFPFLANSRARSVGDTDGMVKILACSSSDRVLGVHIIGPEAGNLIAEVTMAMEFAACSEDIARVCHAHPTLTEAVKEAALAVDKRTLNM